MGLGRYLKLAVDWQEQVSVDAVGEAQSLRRKDITC